jgi:predicted nucleotidyltransferase
VGGLTLGLLNVDTQWIPARLRDSVAALVAACEDDPAVVAAWVGGSLARETADDWSDVDLHVLVSDAEKFGARIADWFGRAMPAVLADQIPGVARGFLFVTPDWIHVDVIVHDTEEFDQGDFPARVLLDPQGLVRAIPASAEQMVGAPYLPHDQVRLYLYFMGVTVTVFRRREWLALAQGAAGFRDSLLIPLMLAENGVRKTDGAKRLNRYLTAEQIAALQAIPPIGSDPEQLLAAHTAIAHEYLTRGRRLAAALEEPWPTALEQASLALWRRELAIDLDQSRPGVGAGRLSRVGGGRSRPRRWRRC